MKKTQKFLALLLSLAVVFSFSACKGSGSKQASSGSQTVTIQFANYALLESGYTQFWNDAKANFEKENPNIKINWVTAPYGDIVNQVVNMAGGGNKVDIMFGDIDWTPTLENDGLAIPVNKVMSSKYLKDFHTTLLNACSIDDKVYAIPMYASPFVLYYNKDIFKQAGLDPNTPPKTYDQMLTMAAKIATLKTSGGNKIYPFGQTTASVAVSGASLCAMVQNFGGSVLTKDGKLNVNQNFIDAFTMLKSLDEKGYNPRNAKLKDLRNLFAIGQLAMYYDQSWGFNGVQSINANAKDFTASAAPLSGGSGKGNSIIQAHVLFLMNSSNEKKAALEKLVEFLTSAQTLQTDNYITSVTPAYPSRTSMDNMSAITNNAVLKGAAGSLDKAQPNVFVPALNDIELQLCTLAQAITAGGKTVDQGISAFKASANASLSK